MKLVELKYRKKTEGYLLRVTNSEAMRIIQSLAGQIETKCPDTKREEFFTNLGYFSIVVRDNDNERNSK